jgi:tRNA(Arg) A34 adenosine deaminase TadA
MTTRPNVTCFVYDKKGNLLSIGRNSYVKTHPVQAKAAQAVGQAQRIFLHAEIHALVQLEDWKKAYRIEVVRYGASGDALMAKPCPVCMHVIKQTGIKKVIHT